jgi:hypothetical protein
MWLKWPLKLFDKPGRYEMLFASHGFGAQSDYFPVVLLSREEALPSPPEIVDVQALSREFFTVVLVGDCELGGGRRRKTIPFTRRKVENEV